MYSILIPENSKIAAIAANEIATLTEKVCGIRPVICFDDPGGDVISIGSDAISVFAHNKIMDRVISGFQLKNGTDNYRIVSAKDNGRTILFLAGGRPRALLYAVYRFFEERASCHWFWDGDIIPSGNVPCIDDIDIKDTPRFEYRGLRYFAHRSLHRFQAEHWDFEDWKREIDWIVKRKMNLFMLRIGMDDIFQLAFPDIVSYPKEYECPEAKPGTYDERTHFWKLETRAKLRKQILDYAGERDLLHPEDFGTPTHWYSRTPLEYLEKVKPAFAPQSNKNYNDATGLVWDISEDENLEAYFKLTEAHIKNYGSPAIFHTIGTGERRFFPDHFRNHELKRYYYRRILSKLREKYGDAPVLIGSWDFISTWTHDEVHEFVNDLNPANTMILDYTSDIWDDVNTFENWGLVGKFPWIFGIFHAYEASNEIRGNYDIIRRRFPKAADDPYCKGVVFWPENSHQDILMLEYFSEISWNPSLYRIEEFLPLFCARRYGENAAGMEELWNLVLPAATTSRWGTLVKDSKRYFPQREIYPDPYFNIAGWFYGTMDAVRVEYCYFQATMLRPHLALLPSLYEKLSKLDLSLLDSFRYRDIIDIARTGIARTIEYKLCEITILIDAWARNAAAPIIPELAGKVIAKEDIDAVFDQVRKLGGLLSDILAASEEFSMNATYDRMKSSYETNPDYAQVLKNNADNTYCRSYIYELARYSYEPAINAVFNYLDSHLSGERKTFVGLDDEINAEIEKVRKVFREKPLEEMRPDIVAARQNLPSLFAELSTLIR